MLLVLVLFLYYPEVVQALNNWVLTASNPLTSDGNNDNPGGNNNSGGNNNNPGGNNDNTGGNNDNDNSGKKRKYSEPEDDNTSKKKKYSESASESESEPEKFYTESVKDFGESDSSNSDEGYDTDESAKARKIEEMENAFMSEYYIKYTTRSPRVPYVEEDPSQTDIEAGPSFSRPQPSLTSGEPLAPISPSSPTVSPNAPTFPNYTTATEEDIETPCNDVDSSTTGNLNNKEYTKNNGKGKQR